MGGVGHGTMLQVEVVGHDWGGRSVGGGRARESAPRFGGREPAVVCDPPGLLFHENDPRSSWARAVGVVVGMSSPKDSDLDHGSDAGAQRAHIHRLELVPA